MKSFNKICNAVTKLYAYIGVGLMAIIFVACALQVFTRYFVGQALQGTEEISRYAFIWASFLGGSLCIQKWSNAQVSILNDALTGKAKLIHSIFIDIMVLLCAGLLFVQGMKCVDVTYRQLSSMLRIRMSYVYAAIPVGAFGIMLSSVQRIVNSIYNFATKEEQV